MRVERGSAMDTAPALRSQSFSVAAGTRVKPLPLHPAALEKKHSHVRRRSSGLFGSKPSISLPRVDHATNVFQRLQTALRWVTRHMYFLLHKTARAPISHQAFPLPPLPLPFLFSYRVPK